MKFKMTHQFFEDAEPEFFTESDAPDWLTGAKTVRGSTMDCRWFFEDHILKLKVGESKQTDFQTIERIE